MHDRTSADSGLRSLEAYSLCRLRCRPHELPNGVEDNFEPRIVFALHRNDPSRKLFIAANPPPSVSRRPQDRDIHLDRLLAPKDTGKHQNAVFREGSGVVFPMLTTSL